MNFQININQIKNGFLVNYNRGESGYMTSAEKSSHYCKTLKEAEIYIHNTVFPVIHAKKEGK